MTQLNSRPEVNDLSLLSLLAAQELERLQRDEPSEGHYLSIFRDRLAAQMTGPTRTDVKNIAPGTVQLYRRAVQAATAIDPPDFGSLVTEINRLLEQLKLASETASANDRRQAVAANLTPLIAFVISLHSQLLAQKQRLSSNRNASRYRV